LSKDCIWASESPRAARPVSVGQQSYEVETIGIADDLSDADGAVVFSFAQAQDAARALMKARANGGRIGPLTVQHAVEEYIEWRKSEGRSVHAVHDDDCRAKAFIYPQLGDIECSALTKDQIEKWHRALVKLSPRRGKAADDEAEAVRRRKVSANKVLSILKAALNRAWRDEKIVSDHAWRRAKPFKNVNVPRSRYLTTAEAKRLVNAIDPEFRSIVHAALETGARYGELCRLEVCDFNPDAGTLAVHQSKSGKPRHIVLTEDGAALFRKLSAGRGGNEFILRRSNGEPFRASRPHQPMITACKRAKISPRISFHGLRHTWASLSVMAGVPLMVVAKKTLDTSTQRWWKRITVISHPPTSSTPSARGHRGTESSLTGK
jgi:integrase